MNDNHESICAALEEWNQTVLILIHNLTEADEDASHEALAILLMQGLDLFGPESVLMQQFFPALDAIKRQLDASDYGTALHMTNRLGEQLDEIRSLVRSASTGEDPHSPTPPPET